jgi:hypothetical protein
MLTGVDVARGLEQAEVLHQQRQVEAYRAETGGETMQSLTIAGGIAVLTEPSFGRKLNHVTGLAMSGAVISEALADVERAYAPRSERRGRPLSARVPQRLCSAGRTRVPRQCVQQYLYLRPLGLQPNVLVGRCRGDHNGPSCR